MSKRIPEGFYRDLDGELKPDRRKVAKERRVRTSSMDGDRRNMQRRKSDIKFAQREHEREIEEALEDFAEEHDQ